GDGIEQRANQLGAADGRAALRTNIGGKPIEEDNLPVEQDDRNLGPRFVVNRRPAWFSFSGMSPSGGCEDIRRCLAFALARLRHSVLRPVVPVTRLSRVNMSILN